MKKIIPKSAVLIPDHAKNVFSGQIFDVYHYEQKLYDGSTVIFESLKRPDTVSVYAVVGEKLIVLEDEQPNREMVLALPGGRIDKSDESALSAAKRETLEETGYEFAEWRLIGVTQPQEKIEWFIYTFLAYGAYTKKEPHIDSGEKIKVLLKTFDDVIELAKRGEPRFTEHRKFQQAISLKDFIASPEFEGDEVER